MLAAILHLSAAAQHPCVHTLSKICSNGSCHPDNEFCPPVTTDPTCGEHPHSGRDGALLTWGLSYRTTSAQECCDRCKGHAKHCNSWTFCGLPVCWGLDTGHNHTFGECWLRRLTDVADARAFRQRGKYTKEWLQRHRRTRPRCRKGDDAWSCPPTWVPYTSGAISGPVFHPTEQFVTGGGWGNVWIKPTVAYRSASVDHVRTRTV